MPQCIHESETTLVRAVVDRLALQSADFRDANSVVNRTELLPDLASNNVPAEKGCAVSEKQRVGSSELQLPTAWRLMVFGVQHCRRGPWQVLPVGRCLAAQRIYWTLTSRLLEHTFCRIEFQRRRATRAVAGLMLRR